MRWRLGYVLFKDIIKSLLNFNWFKPDANTFEPVHPVSAENVMRTFLATSTDGLHLNSKDLLDNMLASANPTCPSNKCE